MKLHRFTTPATLFRQDRINKFIKFSFLNKSFLKIIYQLNSLEMNYSLIVIVVDLKVQVKLSFKFDT